MKRFALAAVVLVLVSVSFAVAQRDTLPQNEPAGVLSELKAGEWVQADVNEERIVLKIAEQIEGKSLSEYRSELKRTRQEAIDAQNKIGEKFAEPIRILMKNRGVQSEELRELQDERKKALSNVPIPTSKTFLLLWEVSEVHSGFVKLTNGERTVAIPEDSIRYISRDID